MEVINVSCVIEANRIDIVRLLEEVTKVSSSLVLIFISPKEKVTPTTSGNPGQVRFRQLSWPVNRQKKGNVCVIVLVTIEPQCEFVLNWCTSRTF